MSFPTATAARETGPQAGRPPVREAGFIAAASVANAAVAMLVLDRFGAGAEGTELALRATARVSLLWFVAAYAARPLHDLFPGGLAASLLRWRRACGVVFGLSMSMHVAFIVRLFALHAPGFPPMVTTADFTIGVPGLVLVALMTATSLAGLRRALGQRRWTALHRTGLHFVWAVFVLCLVDSVGRKEPARPFLEYHLFVLLLLAALAARVAAWRRRAPER